MAEEMLERNPIKDYKCMKCGHATFELHEFWGTGGFWSSLFNLQTEKYRAVVCGRCKFAELYQGNTSMGQRAADFVLGS